MQTSEHCFPSDSKIDPQLGLEKQETRSSLTPGHSAKAIFNPVALAGHFFWRFLHTHHDSSIQKYTQTLEKRVAELERTNTELEQFSYVVSHDLQEPLHSIIGFLQCLKQDEVERLNTKSLGYIGHCIDSTQRMQDLINGLLDFIRIGGQDQPKQEVDCSCILKESLADLHHVITESKAQIECHKLPSVWGYPMLLRLLLQNLISNAIKFRKGPSPMITVSVKEKDAFWFFSVEDDGIGIDPKYFDRIFTIFQRLHHPTEYSGMGIGLAICKKIIELHKGSLWCKSELGKGATFSFCVPKLKYS